MRKLIRKWLGVELIERKLLQIWWVSDKARGTRSMIMTIDDLKQRIKELEERKV